MKKKIIENNIEIYIEITAILSQNQHLKIYNDKT